MGQQQHGELSTDHPYVQTPEGSRADTHPDLERSVLENLHGSGGLSDAERRDSWLGTEVGWLTVT